LTTVEEILKQLAKVVDGLTGIFEGEQDLARKLKTVLILLLSSHFLTSGKVVKMSGTKLANNQRLELIPKCCGTNIILLIRLRNIKVNTISFRYEDQPVPMTIKISRF
jgi:hypothetical protein